MNSQRFASGFVYSSDIDEGPPFCAGPLPGDELFTHVCLATAGNLITNISKLGSDLGILRTCKRISKASAADRTFCWITFRCAAERCWRALAWQSAFKWELLLGPAGVR